MPDPTPFDDKSINELDAILDTITPDGNISTGGPSAPPPAPLPENPADVLAPVQADAPAAEEAPPAEPKPVEAEPVDYRALVETREKELAEARAHNSRLAGKIGYQERLLKAQGRSPAEVPAADAPGAEFADTPENIADRVQRLEEEAEVLRRNDAAREEELAQRDRERIAQIDQAAAARAKQLLVAVDDDVTQTVIAGHADEIREIEEVRDPSRRESLAMELVYRMSSEAHVFQQSRNHERMTVQKTASTAANHKAKQAAFVSGSGSVAAAPPKPRTAADLTIDECDRWLREHVR